MEYFGGTLCKVDDTSNKYLTFLGGDHPITVIKTNVDGPVCMILKESYGNAFTPWLTSHYSQDHRHRSARIQPRRQAEPRSGGLCEGAGRE